MKQIISVLILGVLLVHTSRGQVARYLPDHLPFSLCISCFCKRNRCSKKGGGVQEATLQLQLHDPGNDFRAEWWLHGARPARKHRYCFYRNPKILCPPGRFFMRWYRQVQCRCTSTHRCKVIPPGNPAGYGNYFTGFQSGQHF